MRAYVRGHGVGAGVWTLALVWWAWVWCMGMVHGCVVLLGRVGVGVADHDAAALVHASHRGVGAPVQRV